MEVGKTQTDLLVVSTPDSSVSYSRTLLERNFIGKAVAGVVGKYAKPLPQAAEEVIRLAESSAIELPGVAPEIIATLMLRLQKGKEGAFADYIRLIAPDPRTQRRAFKTMWEFLKIESHLRGIDLYESFYCGMQWSEGLQRYFGKDRVDFYSEVHQALALPEFLIFTDRRAAACCAGVVFFSFQNVRELVDLQRDVVDIDQLYWYSEYHDALTRYVDMHLEIFGLPFEGFEAYLEHKARKAFPEDLLNWLHCFFLNSGSLSSL